MRRARERLAAHYASDATPADKRAGKAAALAQLRAEYETLKAGWDARAGVRSLVRGRRQQRGDRGGGLYTDRLPQFRALLGAEGRDLPRFYARVKALAALRRPSAKPRWPPTRRPRLSRPIPLF